MIEKDDALYLHTVCDCTDVSHSMRFVVSLPYTLREFVVPPEMYVNVQLNTLYPFWKRLWHGLQYAFWKKSKFSHGLWDEGAISPESARELRKLIDRYLEEWDKTEENHTNQMKIWKEQNGRTKEKYT